MISQSCSRRFLAIGGLMAALAVAAGAFGAHMLKGLLDGSMLAVFETAVRYQMYHAIGVCLVALAADRYPASRLPLAGWCFIAGIVLFSGSLYVLALSGVRWLGAVTPLGGVAFIAGWSLLIWQALVGSKPG
ncbi:MAG TPA: DUF423 domain-containing protein [Nitrospira sp.]|nr:DUF423 domain-containing protein [Nitrospira sp.]